MSSIDPWHVDWSDRVKDLPADAPIGKVPTPVIVRAEQLCDALDAAGEHRPDRNFLTAALIATTEPDPEDLAARLRAYRLRRVHEVVLNSDEAEGEVDLPKPKRS
jgi:hypothetical protein